MSIFEPWPHLFGGNDATPPFWNLTDPLWTRLHHPLPPVAPQWTTVTTTVRRPSDAFIRRARAKVR